MNEFNELPAIDLTGIKLIENDLGGTWKTFALSLTPETGELISECYNLLALTELESSLGLSLVNVIISEETDISEKKTLILEILLDNIIEVLTKFGLTLDPDYIEPNTLGLLCKITDLFFVLNGYEDLQSLSWVLEAKDNPPTERFIELYRVLYGLEPSDPVIEDLHYLITDCSEYTLDTLRLSLVVLDGEPDLPEFIKARILKNRQFLDNTIAAQHVRSDGRIGMGFGALRSYYRIELESAMDLSAEHYVKELISLALISDVQNETFWDVVKEIVETNVDDVTLLFKAEKVVKQLNLPEVNTDGAS